MKKTTLFFLFSFVTASAFAQVNLNNGLVLYLPFNGNTLDASANGNNATNYGATLTADERGTPNSAYYFNGVNSYMQIANNTTLQPTTQLTLCAKVKIMGFYDGPCYGNCIIDKGATDYVSGNYSLRFASTIGQCSYRDTLTQNYFGIFGSQPPANNLVNNLPYISKDKWDCLIFKYDGNIASLYVNGIVRYQYAITDSIGTNSHDVFLGYKNTSGYPYWFKGAMDDVRIYNRALNTSEMDSICSKNNNPELAVAEVQTTSALTILSNPVGDNLQLLLPADKLGGRLSIMDLSGKMVIDVPALDKTTIPLTELAGGMYIVHYQLNGLNMRAKIIRK